VGRTGRGPYLVSGAAGGSRHGIARSAPRPSHNGNPGLRTRGAADSPAPRSVRVCRQRRPSARPVRKESHDGGHSPTPGVDASPATHGSSAHPGTDARAITTPADQCPLVANLKTPARERCAGPRATPTIPVAKAITSARRTWRALPRSVGAGCAMPVRSGTQVFARLRSCLARRG
jgi:hypothetical protein